MLLAGILEDKFDMDVPTSRIRTRLVPEDAKRHLISLYSRIPATVPQNL